MRPGNPLLPAAFLIAGFVATCLPSCMVERSWLPTGSVEVIDSYQIDDCPGYPVVVTYRIDNPDGRSPVIYVTTLSLRIETDERTYHRTVVDISRIRPGHTVFGTYEFLPDGAGESFVSATIVDFFVE